MYVEVREEHTFFNSWDKIKHNNIILNWVDNTDEEAQNGISLFPIINELFHGKDYPLGLTVSIRG